MRWLSNIRMFILLLGLLILAYYGYPWLEVAGYAGAFAIVVYGYLLALRFWRIVSDVFLTKDMAVYTLCFTILALFAFWQTKNPFSFAVLIAVYPVVLLKQLYFRLKPLLEEVIL